MKCLVCNLARRLAGLVTSKPRPPLPPQTPSTASFQTLDPSQLIKEETLPMYNLQAFYPVRIGEVVGKLGYSAYSTVWLCHDLAVCLQCTCLNTEHRYVTVKVCMGNVTPVKRELTFELTKSKQPPPPSCDSLSTKTTYARDPTGTPSWPFKCLHILLTLDYLHSEARLIHTDIQENNILLDLDHTPALKAFEHTERTALAVCKGDSEHGRTIYLSHKIVVEAAHYGWPVLCDFGEAPFGGGTTYMSNIQPYQYCAPEVILGTPWGEKVDIWAIGVMYHLAHMVALLGPPPVDLVQCSMTDTPWRYFDRQCRTVFFSSSSYANCTELTEHPDSFAMSLPDDSLEQSEGNLEGEDKVLFLVFMQKMVRWRPEEWCSAKELLHDSWLNRLEGS
ncbi:hypothetical protein V8D89_004247 [Ganoderma adspersum]